MPAECPPGIIKLVETIPLRNTHTALKWSAVNHVHPLPGHAGPTALALCDGSVSDKEEDIDENSNEFLPVSVEKGLDSQEKINPKAEEKSDPKAEEKSNAKAEEKTNPKAEEKSNHVLSAREKLERLRMAVKKQDAEKKGEVDAKNQEVKEDVEAAKEEVQKEQLKPKKKNDSKNHNTKRNITEKKNGNGKCGKSEEKKKSKEQNQKEKKQVKCQKPGKTLAKEEAVVAVVSKEEDEKNTGKKRKALSMTKKCYTSRAYHQVYDLAKKNGDPEAMANARDASYKAGLQWEDLYGERALVSA